MLIRGRKKINKQKLDPKVPETLGSSEFSLQSVNLEGDVNCVFLVLRGKAETVDR